MLLSKPRYTQAYINYRDYGISAYNSGEYWQIMVFWDVGSCNLVERYQHTIATPCMEEECSSETLVPIFETEQLHISIIFLHSPP
jgi:hypothetical protein